MTMLKTIRQWTQICVSWIQSTHVYNIRTHCDIILPHITICLLSCLRFPRTSRFWTLHLSPYTRYVPTPHTAWSEHGHDNKTRAKSITLLLMWHYHETSSPLGPNIRFSILFSQLSIHDLMLRVTDQVSQFFKNRSAVDSSLTSYSKGMEFISWLEHRLFTFVMIFLNLSEQTPG
jgi:hypothetical protein